MSISGISKNFPGIEQIKNIKGPEESAPAQGGKPFNDMLSDAIREVDDLQHSADQQIEGLTLGKDGFTSHGAAIALEKADIAFQLMNTIRAKIIRAYEEVIRTQV